MVGLDSAFVGMTDGGGGFPRARVMTECFFGCWGMGDEFPACAGIVDSRLRGNDGWWGWIPLSWE